MVSFVTSVSREEIEKVIIWAIKNNGKYHGQTYEEGLRDLGDWILGEGDHPLEGEEVDRTMKLLREKKEGE